MQIFFRMVIDFACGAMGMKKDDLPRLDCHWQSFDEENGDFDN